MPRTKASARRGRSQNTLQFSSKVTKPSVSQSQAVKDLEDKAIKVLREDDTQAPSPSPVPDTAQIEEKPTTAELAIRQQTQAEAEAEVEVDGPEDQAMRITDLQIQRYWKSKEDGRKAPRGMGNLHVLQY